MSRGDERGVRLAAESKEDYKDTSKKPSPSESVDRTGKCFYISAEEIRANKYDLSISRYKQIEHKEIEYEKPEAIMAKVKNLEKEIEKDITDIGTMIDRKFPDFWEHPTIEELAKQQGVKPVEKFGDLLGNFWPEDENIDEFIEWYRKRRKEGTSREHEE